MGTIVTTSTITWHPASEPPDAESNVLIALNVDGIKTSCEGFISTTPDDRECWYDVTAQPLPHEHVRYWADLPECPL